MYNNNEGNTKNLIIAIVLSTLIILSWSYFFPAKDKKSSKNLENKSVLSKQVLQKNSSTKAKVPSESSRIDIKAQSITLKSGGVIVKINTKGLKIEDIILINNDTHSTLVDSKIFAQTGVISQTHAVPNSNTVWNVVENSSTNAIFETIINGVVFRQEISFIENNILDIQTYIHNQSTSLISFNIFSRINQNLKNKPKRNAISHEGPIAYTDERLYEKSYHKMRKEDFQFHNEGEQKIWSGISDKYTLVSYIVNGKQTIGFNHPRSDNDRVFQVDTLSDLHTLPSGNSLQASSMLFIGKKNLQTLETFGEKYNIPHLDKAIDFGFLYFITKPIFLMLHFIYIHIGSFAVAIVLLTFIIKLMLLPLTIKSSISMAKMKKLQPEIKRLQEFHKNDKKAIGQATIKLYQEKKVNPLAGCLPMLVQIPIFFALYKVLYVSTEMSNAPLFFWISDLSNPDPTSIINLFGLLPFNTPSFLGVLPITFGISMFLYQKVSPQPADKTQAQIMKLLPIVMTIFLSGFAAGLLFYWIINNLLSIIQQIVIEKFIIPCYHRKHSHKK